MASGIVSMYDIDKIFEGSVSWASYTNSAANTSTIVFTGAIRKVVSPAVMAPFEYSLAIYEPDRSSVIDMVRSQDAGVATVSGENVELFTYEATIPHNPDGKKSVLFSCDIYRADGGEGGVSTSVIIATGADGVYNTKWREDADDYPITLDTIIRKATMKTAPNIDDNTVSIPITYTNPMGQYVSSVEVCIANETGNQIIVPYRQVNKTGSAYTFNLSSTERQALVNNVINGTSATIRFYIRTIVYDTYHYDFLIKTYTLTSAMPTISTTIADMNETTLALTGDYNTFIRYMSTAAVSINAVAKQGATIVRCDCECGSYNEYNTNGIFRVPGVETGVFTVKATDSRGNTVSQTIQKTMMLYEKVSCNLGVEMELVGSTGAQATMYIRGNYYNGRFGTTSAATSNSFTLEYRRTDDRGAWGEWTTIPVPSSALSNNKYSLEYTISDLDYKSQYKFQCRASDKLMSVESDVRTSILQPVFDWSATDFNFNVPVKFQSEYAMNDYIVDYGTDQMGTNGTWYWFKYKSGRSECYGLRNFGNMGVSTALGAMYRSTAFTQDLPQDVFLTNSVPDYISINVVANGTGWICRDGSGSSPAYYTTGSFYVVSPTSGTQSAVWLSFHVMGRWK